MKILDKILAHKKADLIRQKEKLPLGRLLKLIRPLPKRHHALRRALLGGLQPHLICEMKRVSPSSGILRKKFKPVTIAKEFEAGGASAISILTERRFFQGTPQILKRVRRITKLPILRKDFMIDPYQVCETFFWGADAFLLIVSILNDDELNTMVQLGDWFGLDALVEVRTKNELRRALKANAKIVGINNRDLKTLRVNPFYATKLLPLIPKNRIIVIESGIQSRDEIGHYQRRGVNCFLVGSALIKSNNIKCAVRNLLGKHKGRSRCRK